MRLLLIPMALALFSSTDTPEEWSYDLERTNGGWKLLNKDYRKL